MTATASTSPSAHPASSRRRQLAATSARSLLLTVLGEFALPQREPVWTQVLIDVLGGLGVEQKSARQALARTAAEGVLQSERTGRRVRWALTEAGRQLLADGAERIYGFGAPGRQWDGRWLVLLVSVPESRRQLRHRLRTQLAWAGLGSPSPGVWLSPDPDKQDEVARVISELRLAGVTASFVGSFGEVGEQHQLVTQAWNLAAVERAYREFIATFEAANPSSAGDVLQHQIHLVHAWRRFPFLDPQLPAELLADGWIGTSAAGLFEAKHSAWHEAAQGQWHRLVAGVDGAA